MTMELKWTVKRVREAEKLYWGSGYAFAWETAAYSMTELSHFLWMALAEPTTLADAEKEMQSFLDDGGSLRGLREQIGEAGIRDGFLFATGDEGKDAGESPTPDPGT